MVVLQPRQRQSLRATHTRAAPFQVPFCLASPRSTIWSAIAARVGNDAEAGLEWNTGRARESRWRESGNIKRTPSQPACTPRRGPPCSWLRRVRPWRLLHRESTIAPRRSSQLKCFALNKQCVLAIARQAQLRATEALRSPKEKGGLARSPVLSVLWIDGYRHRSCADVARHTTRGTRCVRRWR